MLPACHLVSLQMVLAMSKVSLYDNQNAVTDRSTELLVLIKVITLSPGDVECLTAVLHAQIDTSSGMQDVGASTPDDTPEQVPILTTSTVAPVHDPGTTEELGLVAAISPATAPAHDPSIAALLGIPEDVLLTDEQRETLAAAILKYQKQLCAWMH